MSPCVSPARRRAHKKIRAAVEVMERRILLSTITVNTFADQIDPAGSSTISLRDAIALAAKLPGPDTINLPTGDYKLTLDQLRISDTSGNLTITSAAGATIDGQKKSTILDNYQGNVTLHGLTITGSGTSPQDIGSGILNTGNLTMSDCTVTANAVAGIFNDTSGSTQTLTLSGCAIIGNASDGIDNLGPLIVLNSTISGNIGYGISSQRPASVYDSTITGNTKAGLNTYSGDVPTCANSILAQNGSAKAADVQGQIHSLGHNLIGNARGSTGWTLSDQTGNDFAPIDPRLSPLGHFGGLTLSMAPMAGSPALAAGAIGLIPKRAATDQRGLPRVSGGGVDIGAVQTRPPAKIQITPPPAQSFIAGQAGAVALGTFSAPSNAAQFVMTVVWGDGSADSVLTLPVAGSLGTLHHTFASGGTLTPQIAVTDRFGDLSNVATFTANVTIAAPVSFVVNTAQDQTDQAGSGIVSLRDAIDRANQSRGPVSIIFDPTIFNKPTTISLNGTQLELSDKSGPISLIGPAAGLTISGGGPSRAFVVDRGVSATFNGLTFAGNSGSGSPGDPTRYGGAIENLGALTLSHCTISNSSATSGGGIANEGDLSLLDSQITSNSCPNNGGAIYNSGKLLIQRSTISGNTAGGGGAVVNRGDATVADSTIVHNQIYIDPYSNSYYASAYGGGIVNSGKLVVTNCTVALNNTGFDGGGGIENDGIAQIDSSTITGNSGFGGGIDNQKGATLTLADTIVAGNNPLFGYFDNIHRTAGPTDVAGAIISLGHNLIGKSNGSSGWIKTDFKGSRVHPIDPHLSPLDDYGGPTQTQFPMPGSPAIGAGSARLLPPGTTTDQRGFARITGGVVDIGAVQLQRTHVVTIASPPDQAAVAGVKTTVQLGSFTDPAVAGPFHVTIDWGDGSANVKLALRTAGSLGAMNHTFINTGALMGSIYIVDSLGDVAVSHFTIAAAAHPPVTVIVNSINDWLDPVGSANVSLRDAINIADQGFGPVTIAFDPKVFSIHQVIGIKGEGVGISHNTFGLITLAAPAAGLTLRGLPPNDYPYDTYDFGPILSFGHGVSANIGGITFRAGGINNAGTLSIYDSGISGGNELYGGGIYNSGTLTLTRSTVSGNTAYTGTVGKGDRIGGGGGGIFNSGQMSIVDSTITNNTASDFLGGYQSGGGGIYNSGALSIADTVISGNTVGGIWNSGSLSVTRSSVSGNVGGGIIGSGHLDMTDSDVADNTIGQRNYSYYSAAGIIAASATLTNSTISGNAGGGVSAKNLLATNCTISGNTNSGSQGFGGGISSSHATLFDCTITDNGGGVSSRGSITVANTIIAANQMTGGGGPDVFGKFLSLGHNLIGQTDGSSGWIGSDLSGTSASPLDPLLSPLGNFGGPTPTIVPMGNSPALGAGSVALLPAGTTSDQRGFPRIVGGKVDIGAVQTQTTPRISVTGPANQSAFAGIPVSIALGSFSATGGKGPYTVLTLPATGSLGAATHRFVTLGVVHASVAVTDSLGALSNRVQFTITSSLAPPTSIVVNTTADQTDPAGSKTVSLRDAVEIAGNTFGNVSITFDPHIFAAAQTIALDSQDVELGTNIYGVISIIGPAAGLTVKIQGNGRAGVFAIDSGVTADLVGLTISDGGDDGSLSNHGNVSISDCTFTDAQYGSAINNYGKMTITNSTLHNDGGYFGGAIYNDGTMTIASCTITDNAADKTGGGIDNVTGASLTIANTIVAGNTGDGPDVFGKIKSLGHNLIGQTDGSSGWIGTDLTGTTAHPLDPKLSPLANHGGSTQTQLPLAGSPAIDAGSVALVPPDITTDQRGKPRVVNGKIDIGAVQLQPNENTTG
jgi:hypothetical protein